MTDLVCLSPIDGRELVRRPLSTHAEVERAAARARKAQHDWAQAPLEERCAVMLRFVEAMETLNPEIVPELAWQMGRPVRYGGELRSLAERVRGLVAVAPKALAPELPASADGIVRRVDRCRRPVLVVAPGTSLSHRRQHDVAALLAGMPSGRPSPLRSVSGSRRCWTGRPAHGLFTNLFLDHETAMQALGSALVDHATLPGRWQAKAVSRPPLPAVFRH
jgi:hypothetical protein